ncbi:MAG: hypothetical protein BRC28_03185 [Nanohaloarchaea archaeon SW_4_43_9]|nr:MAG: hypothetical protein BRC28_03185 [Nanohaloarchaea archaeon SW_4_43_9]
MNKTDIITGLKNPCKVPKYLYHRMKEFKYYFDFQNLEVDEQVLSNYKQAREKIELEFQSLSGQTRGENYSPGVVSREDAENLKGLIQEQEPDIVVETGVCNGMSTLAILESLDASGKLCSIDLPEKPNSSEDEFWSGKGGSVIPPNKSPGWIIPEDLRENWELILGNSMYELPDLLEDLEKIDIFIHDSEHSYEMMMFEFCLAWKHLKKGGYLVCDDHNWNNAFHDFAEEKELAKYRIGNLGLVQK